MGSLTLSEVWTGVGMGGWWGKWEEVREWKTGTGMYNEKRSFFLKLINYLIKRNKPSCGQAFITKKKNKEKSNKN